MTQTIHVIQTEMGITGTTAKETSTTIKGSVNSMKVAWENLLIGMANENADMDALIDNFVESVAGNILPIVSNDLDGLKTLIGEPLCIFL